MSQLSNDAARFSRAIYRKDIDRLTVEELHDVLSRAVMLRIGPVWEKSRRRHGKKRRAYYLSAEFLVGRAVENNLLCTGLWDEAATLLDRLGYERGCFEDIEDAALGNGGLGRLAACFLDSAATRGLPLDGYGIRYRYGLFKQSFDNGFQRESADDWARFGDPWSMRCEEDAVLVHFGDGRVRAVPYDMPIIGWGGRHISTLRLWQCEPVEPFDFAAFNEQKYTAAVRDKNRAEDVSRVLYPNDSTPAGKILRLKQQYFFAAASVQDMLRRFEADHGTDWNDLPRFITVQLNDTHPVIAVPELILRLMERQVKFPHALALARQVFNYTNHTVMAEAMERWDMGVVRRVNPAMAGIIRKIARAQERELDAHRVPEDCRAGLRILQDNTVHMAHLACFASAAVNGVAHIHTDLLKSTVLREWETLYPGKIQNKTNGVTQRRFLALANRPLAALITEKTGDNTWITAPERLANLKPFADDPATLDRFMGLKRENKARLSAYMTRRGDGSIDPDAILDVQIKRLHEYKRQLLNALSILELYFEIREGKLPDFFPTVFLFGAKAAPGYRRAKAVIKLIHEVARLVEEDDTVRQKMQVVFVTGYDVSYAEKIIAAADVSEQISAAGTEASGTGNMKLMMNGAVTLGTYDGANAEIVAAAGEENNYIFGARVEDLHALTDYVPRQIYAADDRVKRCVDALVDGTLDDGGTGMFRELYDALLTGADWHPADHYYVLLDFADYLDAKQRVNRDYAADRTGFAAKQWKNIAAAGGFSADRTVEEYAKEIWKING